MFAFVDIEASGLVNGFPIEIGWAREDGHVGALLIRPHSEWLSDLAWDPNAEYLHGLPRDLLLARGTPIDDTVDQLNVALRGCRCISDSPSNDWRWLFLLLEFYDRGERQFTFDLLADPAEPLILGIAESVCRSHEFVDDVLRSTSAHRAHTAAGDAATWAAALDAIKKSGNIELILPTWREHARNAMPWRSSKTADVAEIAEEQLAKFDDALRELANGPAPPKPPAYDEDFFAWTQDQAAALRALPRTAVGNRIDIVRIAEEIEDLGKRDIRDVESHLRRVLTLLLKLAALPHARERTHWLAEVEEFQARAAETFKPSMSQLVDLDRAWSLAKRSATTVVEEMGGASLNVPTACPFGLDELVAEDFDARSALLRFVPPAPRP
ncbi:MAG: DUF29 domain-containing protein [Azospirillum sp.]|nr:DUF29 domain-containing protein [Azospirillum sp.]